MDYPFYSAVQPSFHFYGNPTPQQAGTPHTEQFHPDAHSARFDYSFDSFEPPLSIDPNPILGPSHSPPDSFSQTPITSSEVKSDLIHFASTDGGEDHSADRNPGRSSSEEKDALTPAQSRRKAQNRAAQRAFRERKERHVRELEQKLNDLQQTSSNLHADNERLKRELAKIATENEILRATSHAGIATSVNGHGMGSEPSTTGPMRFLPTDCNSKEDGKRGPVHRILVCEETGEKLLDASATWDMIQHDDLYKQGLVDVAHVFEKLKGRARCDGQGPVFEEGKIRRAIKESVAGGRDELI